MTALAVFDLDGTLVDGDSHAALLRGLLGDRAVPAALRAEIVGGAAAWAVGLLDNTWTKSVAARALAGRSEAEIARGADALCRGWVMPRLRHAVVADVERARRAGRTTVLLSASLQPVVDAVAVALGIDVAVGARLGADGGVLTGALVGEVPWGEAKARALARLAAERGADLAASSGWGDSHADRFFLALVGEAHAVAPDRRLRAHAERRGWVIVEGR